MKRQRVESHAQIEVTNLDTDHFYFSITMENPPTSTTIPFYFQLSQNFNEPYLDNPSDYKMAVLRLLIDGSEIPLLDASADTYAVMLAYNGHYSSLNYLDFTNVDEEGSGGVLTIRDLFNVINTTFDTCLSDLGVNIPSIPSNEQSTIGGSTVKAPLLIFDPNTDSSSIKVQACYINDTYPTIIYFNLALANLLKTYNYVAWNSTVNSHDNICQLQMADTGDNYELIRYPGAAIANSSGAVSTEEYPGFSINSSQGSQLSVISQLRGFLIQSNSFTSRVENKNYSTLVNTAAFSTNAFNQQNTIFSLGVDGSGDNISKTYSYTSNNNRWIDLMGKNPLNYMNFTVYYEFNDGSLRPVQIGVGRSCSILFLFQRIR